MTLYPEVIQKCLDACGSFRDRSINIDELQRTISWVEKEIVSHEEKELRKFFMLIENEIDYIRVMNNEIDFKYDSKNDEVDVTTKILPIIDKVESECKKWLT